MTLSRTAAIDSAVDALIEMGFSARAARRMAEEAAEEAASRNKAAKITEKIKATPYQAWLKQSAPEYVWDKPVHRVLCQNVDDILAGRIRRLGIFMPPRLGKSAAVTERLPVYFLEANPTARVIIGAYNRDLAKLFTSSSLRIYRSRNPDMIASEAQEEWMTKAGGSVLAAGVGSGVTGRGADCLVGETMVKTTDGDISIRDLFRLQCRPDVLAYDHASNLLVYRKIVAAREIAAHELVEITTQAGRKIRSTKDHRFWTPESGYKKAEFLRPGDRLVVARECVPVMWGAQATGKQDVSGLLQRDAQADGDADVLVLWQRVRKECVRAREVAAQGARRSLLLQDVLGATSCSQEQAQMRNLRRAGRKKDWSAVLLGQMSGNSARTGQAEAEKGLPLVWRGICRQEQPADVLQQGVRGSGALRQNVRRGEFALQGRHELRQTICRNASNRTRPGQPPLRAVQCRREDFGCRVVRADDKAYEFSHASHQRDADRQPAREFDNPLQGLPYASSQVEEADFVADIRIVRGERVEVYDIQVEGCRNFFANEVLVHNCIIIDDPVKNYEEAISIAYQNRVWQWWLNDIRTRVNNIDRTPIVLIQCIAEGQRVLMGDGTWRQIEGVVPGERVASYDFERGFVSSSVLGACCSGEDDLLTVRTDRHALTTNGRHPYLVIPGNNMRPLNYEWRRAKDLRVGDVLVTLKAFNVDDELWRTPVGDIEITADFMWLFGYMMGDGWVATSHHSDNGFYTASVCVAQGVYDDRNERAVALIGAYGGQRVYLTSGRYYRSDCTSFGRTLRELGLVGGAKGKRIPAWVYRTSQEMRRSFIRGLVDSDGSRYKNRTPEVFAFTTSNPQLVDDARLLALTCGLRPTNVHTYDTVSQPPGSPEPVESIWSHIDITFRQSEFEGISKISPWSDHRDRFPYLDARLDEIRSIESSGRGRVYDLAIDGENFVAEGLVVHNTRWHELDLAGRILEQDKRRGLWRVISFPALAGENDALGRTPGESIWPERLPAEELEQIKEEMGVRFDALYQQDPTPAEGGLIQEAWFWKSVVGERRIISEVRAWDLAASVINRKNSNPDFTVGVRMTLLENDGKMMYAVRDCARIRAEPGQRDNFIVDVCISDGPEVLQLFEENDDGDKTVTHQLRQRLEPYGIGVEGAKPKNDKVVRSTNARSALQRGDMFLVDGRWNYDFVSELVRFPNGRHDDQVDAWSSAYNHLVMRAVRVDIR